MSMEVIAVLGIVALMILLFLGMNIGISMLAVGFVGFMLCVNTTAALGVLKTAIYSNVADYSMAVVPLFILMGEFAYCSGLSDGLFTAASKWLSRLPGNLACASILACAGFGAICGSPTATAATMGVVAVPAMQKRGYADSLTTGSISMGGTLGIIIPPSITFIFYGIICNESVGALFAAGIIPGIILTLVCILAVVFQVKHNPALAPVSGKCSLREKLATLNGIWGVLILFVIIIGGIFVGWFTPNEGAAIGCFLALIYMAITKTLTWKNIVFSVTETAKATGMTFLILMGATVFGQFLAVTRVPQKLADYAAGLNVSRYVILAVIILIYIFLGMIMDTLPMMLITVPCFAPLMTVLGFDLIWFGVLIVLVSQLGLITPPVGLNCYVMAGIAKGVPLQTIFKGSIPFVVAVAFVILLVIIFPGLATWLPGIVV